MARRRATFGTPGNPMAYQQCIHPDCGRTFGVREVLFSCPTCSSLLDVRYDWDKVEVPKSMRYFESRWGTKGLSRERAAQAIQP